MNRTAPSLLCAVALGAIAANAQQTPRQEKSHDALAHARAKAEAENQRVLLLLTGGDAAVGDALTKAMTAYNTLGKLLRYEYQVVALPAASLAGTALRGRLGLKELALPALAVLDTDDAVLGRMDAKGMAADGSFSAGRVRAFLESKECVPRLAREVLADGLAVAKKSARDAFVYLSAPW
jgi:hypothetical protein